MAPLPCSTGLCLVCIMCASHAGSARCVSAFGCHFRSVSIAATCGQVGQVVMAMLHMERATHCCGRCLPLARSAWAHLLRACSSRRAKPLAGHADWLPRHQRLEEVNGLAPREGAHKGPEEVVDGSFVVTIRSHPCPSQSLAFSTRAAHRAATQKSHMRLCRSSRGKRPGRGKRHVQHVAEVLETRNDCALRRPLRRCALALLAPCVRCVFPMFGDSPICLAQC